MCVVFTDGDPLQGHDDLFSRRHRDLLHEGGPMTHPRPQVASLGTAYATYRASLAGEAFQLHDDLLGVSGDPRPTGTGQQ